MLIGSKKPAPATAAENANTANIFDVDTTGFEDNVMTASMETPIVVDFWAPWCGPCKQLGPALEAAVTATNGKVRMAKVNVDENQELAQAMRVQSIPTVFVFFQGQPITAFTGVRSPAELKTLMDQLSKMGTQAKPDAINVPETLSAAAKALAEGQIESAQGLYMQVLAQEEFNAAAYAGLVRSFIAAGDLEQAAYMIEDAPDEIKKHADFAAAKTAVELAQNAPAASNALDDVALNLARDPDNHVARFDYAQTLFAAGNRSGAIDQLIEIMRRDKGNEKKWEDDKARVELLKFFDAMGPADPETVAGRRKLSSLLFS